jgi:hypothetical protein
VEWEHELAKDPQNVSLRVRVADFHLRTKQDPAAAHAHYLKARQLGSAGNDLARSDRRGHLGHERQPD